MNQYLYQLPYCAICGRQPAEFLGPNESRVCQTCYQDIYMCVRCEEIIYKYNMKRGGDGRKYCVECWDKIWRYCKECGCIYKRDDTVEGEDCNSARYCQECRERKKKKKKINNKRGISMRRLKRTITILTTAIYQNKPLVITLYPHNVLEIRRKYDKVKYVIPFETLYDVGARIKARETQSNNERKPQA